MNNVNALNVNKEESVTRGSSRSRRKRKAERVQRASGSGGPRLGLKAERVQLAAGGSQQKLKAERVQELLSRLPGWELTTAGGAIGKEWRFPRPQVAAAFAASVAGLAAAEGKTLHLVLSGAVVSLVLATRLPGGIREGLTENDFRFAARLG